MIVVTVLDYFNGEVHVLNCSEDEDVEQFLESKGFHLNDCHYMTSKSFKMTIDI